MKKIVIFDWGGVILKEFPNHYCDRDAIAETFRKFNSSLSFSSAYEIYKQTLKDENGNYISVFNDEKNKYAWFQRVNEKAGLNTTYEKFVEEITNNYKKIDKYDKVVEFIYSLKDKAKLCLFSDLIFVCYEALAKQIDLNVFDQVFLSYEEGYVKTYVDAFINVDTKLNRNGQEVLFIDNNSLNISNAKKVGWNTFQATGDDIDKIKEAVNDFLNNRLVR